LRRARECTSAEKFGLLDLRDRSECGRDVSPELGHNAVEF
jgi:hypothetical protein